VIICCDVLAKYTIIRQQRHLTIYTTPWHHSATVIIAAVERSRMAADQAIV